MKSLWIVLGIVFLNGCLAGPTYNGEVGKNFDGKHFKNTLPGEKGLWDVLKLSLSFPFYKEPWPDFIPVDPQPLPSLAQGQIGFSFVGHSTFVIHTQSTKILTDPVFSDRASPFSWIGPKRVRPPAIKAEQISPIDAVLISHNHYDHMDEASLRKLADGQTLIVAGLGNKTLLDSWGLTGSVDLNWNQKLNLKQGTEIWFTESRHRSGRGLSDQMGTLWGAFLIRLEGKTVYFAGDTGYGPHFKDIRENFGPIDYCIIPIGAYSPRWFMKEVHLDPKTAVDAHNDLGCKQSFSAHFGTFQLTFEAIEEPQTELESHIAKGALKQGRFDTLQFGETRVFKIKD